VGEVRLATRSELADFLHMNDAKHVFELIGDAKRLDIRRRHGPATMISIPPKQPRPWEPLTTPDSTDHSLYTHGYLLDEAVNNLCIHDMQDNKLYVKGRE
jgi:hypothetical protein